jgi:hAT family C-terminal dimerisation region
MAVVLSFWDGKLNSEMLKMKRVKDATAEGLFTALIAELAKSKIPESRMVGFSADTCNTMFGERNSVSQKLRAQIPHLLTVKCSCHSCHLCSSKAFAMLPALIEEFLRLLSAFFTSSYKNKDEFAEFQEFCETAAHSILKPGLTRWLTLQPCAARVLEQYNPLLLFFTSLVSEKPNDSNMKMLSLLKDPFTKCYLEFLVYALEKFNKFNATFQNNQPLLHELQDYVNHLILDLSRSFMDGAYVDSFKSSPLKIDPKKDERFLPLRSIHVGKCKMPIVHSFFSLSKIEYLQILIGLKASQAITDCQQPRAISDPAEKQYFTLYFPKEKEEAEKKAKKFALDYVKSNLIPVPDKNSLPTDPIRKNYDSVFQSAFNQEFERSFHPIDNFFLSVRNFYAKAVYEFKTRFNFEDDVYKILPILKPKNARKLSPQSLSCLFTRYPILRDHVNEDDADNEWRAHVNLSCDYFNVSEDFEFHNMDAEFYWNRVFSSKSPSGEIRFPNLKVCISLLLTLPFSNAAAERFFSHMKDTKPPKKNGLHDKSVDAVMKGKIWLKSNGANAGSVTIPDSLLQLSKTVKTNAAIVSSDSD